MDVIYTLIPGMIFLGLILVAVLIWAVKKGQYEDLEGDAHRILMDDDEEKLPDEVRQQKKQERDRRNWPDADED